MCTCPESTHNITSSPEANGASGLSSSSTTRIRLSPTMIVATIVPAIVFKYRTWPVRGYLVEVIMALFPLELIAQLQHPNNHVIGILGGRITSAAACGGDCGGRRCLKVVACKHIAQSCREAHFFRDRIPKKDIQFGADII